MKAALCILAFALAVVCGTMLNVLITAVVVVSYHALGYLHIVSIRSGWIDVFSAILELIFVPLLFLFFVNVERLEKWFRENPPESVGYTRVVRKGIAVFGTSILAPLLILAIWSILSTH